VSNCDCWTSNSDLTVNNGWLNSDSYLLVVVDNSWLSNGDGDLAVHNGRCVVNNLLLVEGLLTRLVSGHWHLNGLVSGHWHLNVLVSGHWVCD
jgi:hypothetical protein